MLRRIVATAPKQQFLKNFQVSTYATEGKATLSEDVRSHLKPEVLSIVEAKSDYALIRKLNKIGKFGAIRLNTASKVQLQSINAQTIFKMVSFELDDPWVYYWTKVCENGQDPEKWLISLKELSNVPPLVERCFREMMCHNCYPRPEHFAEFMKAAASMGDYQTCSILGDEFKRCTTNKLAKKPSPDLWKSLLDSFIKAKEYNMAELAVKQVEKNKTKATPEQETALSNLKSKQDPKSYGEFLSGKTQTAPGYIQEIETTAKDSLTTALKQLAQFIQPPFDKLASPDELSKRKYEQSKAAQKQ